MKSRWHNIMLFWSMCQGVSCLRICEFSGCAQDRIGLSGDVQGLTFDLHHAIGLRGIALEVCCIRPDSHDE
jgi:hypothetical protein